MQIAKDEFLKLRANEENWLETMEKIVFRDVRKEALHLERKEKLIDKVIDERADNDLLTNLLPTPLM